MPMHKGKENPRKGGGYNGGQYKGESSTIFREHILPFKSLGALCLLIALED